MIAHYVPERGDVVWINFSPQRGHEQSGKRPALVLSPSVYNEKVGLAIFCPITNQVKNFPFEVVITEGLGVKGVILSDHVRSLDWKKRKVKFICKLPRRTILEVLQKLNTLTSFEYS